MENLKNKLSTAAINFALSLRANAGGRKHVATMSRALAGLVLLAGSFSIFCFAPSAKGALNKTHNFPNVKLTTQEGQKVAFYDDLIKGKKVVINVIFTQCVDVCALETSRLVQVQRILGDRMGKDVFFYSISIDPERDTPQVLKEYAENYHVGPGWLFLTGKKDDIEKVSKHLGMYDELDSTNRDGHAASVLIGNDATGEWVRKTVDNPRVIASTLTNGLQSARPSEPQGIGVPQRLDVSNESKGRYVFATHCAACHSVGHGDKTGPDLKDVAQRRDRTWLKHFIEQPNELLTQQDPTAMQLLAKYRQVQMPNMHLDDPLANAVIDYLQSEGPAKKHAPVGAGRPSR